MASLLFYLDYSVGARNEIERNSVVITKNEDRRCESRNVFEVRASRRKGNGGFICSWQMAETAQGIKKNGRTVCEMRERCVLLLEGVPCVDTWLLLHFNGRK